MRRGVLTLAVVMAAACGTSSPAERPDGPPQPIGVAPPDAEISPEGSPLELAPAPQPLFEASGVRRVQSALAARGIETPATGRYDGRTQQSMLEFQRREGLAATGMPDLLTLERLGLDAKELYR